jgi:tail accessory factor
MSKVAELVRSALLILRVADAKQPVKDVDMRDGISALNKMMRRFEANGLALGWADVESPSDDLPLPPEADDPIAYNLALRLRSNYGVALDPDVIELARQGLQALRRDRMVECPLVWDQSRHYYDIRSDSYI